MAMRWMVALIWRLPPRSRRWRLVLAELMGRGCDSGGAGELGVTPEAAGAPAISPTSLAAVSGPKPGLERSCGRDALDEGGDLGF